MSKQNKYPIQNFYIGELYLYKLFAGLSNGESITDGKKRIQELSNSSAICFQEDEESRYIDWENNREYIGFLTIFYREGNNYICIHNGKTYQLNGPNIIDGLTPLSDLLPTIDTKRISHITIYEGLELFDMLFGKRDNKLYTGKEMPVSNFYVGNLELKTSTSTKSADQRIKYIDLPQCLMLDKSGLGIAGYSDENHTYTTYKGLILLDGVDFCNLHNNQFYNPHEYGLTDITPFREYMDELNVRYPTRKLTIPRARSLFRKMLEQDK